MDETEFVNFATDYYAKLVEPMRNSFYDPETLFRKMEDGYERHYLKIVAYHNGKKLAHGIACVNVDQTAQSMHRAFIRHVSVIRPELFPQALKIVLDFVWRRIHCDQIRLELFHTMNVALGKPTADPEIKKAVAAEKFKW